MNTITLTPLNPGSISRTLVQRLTGLAGLLLLAGAAHAATLTVLNNADSGPGSLRQAIAEASPGDEIVFDDSLNGQTITLTTGQLLITKALSIVGPGPDQLAISANSASSVIQVNDGQLAQVSVNLFGLTIKDGATTGSGGGIFSVEALTLDRCIVSDNSAEGSGAGIYNGGTLDIVASTVSGNAAAFAGGTGGGGGIANDAGIVNLIASNVSGNAAAFGGGIFNGGTLNVINSTLSGNLLTGTGTKWGGGIYNSNSSAVDLINSTITDNSALSGGGCFNNNGEMLLKNTVMAGNAASSGPDIWSNQDVLSNGANFIGTTANIQNAGTLADRTFANTGTTLGDLLAPLTDNGGPTPTHALVAGSPAMDAGINTDAVDLSNNPLATDQRGFARIINGVVDIGAFESEAADNDGDGVADDNDQCPNSDLRLTVWIGGCDSGVSNDIDGALVDADGCSLADHLAHQLTTAATGARNHGRFVSALARYLNALVRAGIITWAEHEALMDCIGSANRIDFLLP